VTSAAQAAVLPSSGSGLVWTLKRGLPILVLVFAGMLYLGARFTLGVNGQVQKCLPPYSFFLVDRHDDRLERGRILAFWAGLRMAPWFPPDLMVVKRLVGLPGDRIVVSAEATTVNGLVVGEGLDVAPTLQRPAADFERELVLGPKELWIMGDTRDSFDSRYWGSLPIDQVIGRGYGLW
jgi:conjugal transfer pilin signal peptidase TrbI